MTEQRDASTDQAPETRADGADDDPQESPEPAEDAPEQGDWPALEDDQLGTPRLLSSDFTLAEGPVWDHCNDRLLFADVEASVVHAIDADDNVSVVRENTGYANGLAFDPDGRLLLAEMGGGEGGRIVRVEADDSLTVLADKTPDGSPLNTSDDLSVRSDGTIYFTDPVIPHGPSLAFSFSPEPVYRIAPDTQEISSQGTTLLPNGVDLSPDEKTLYVNAYLLGQVLRYAVAEDGSLGDSEVLVSGLSAPDSTCLDAAGNLYVGVRQGLAVVRPDGSVVTTIAMDTAQGVTNCGFGGEDGKTLYITAWTSLWKLEDMPIPGLDWQVNQRSACQR